MPSTLVLTEFALLRHMGIGIKLHYLSAYSPKLNLIERPWKMMNEHDRNNKYFATAKDFRRSINKFLDSILPIIGAALSCRINDNFHIFNFT